MPEPHDPLLLPTWIQIAVTGVVAIVTGIIGAASTALLVALGITRKFAEMDRMFTREMHGLRTHVDMSDSKRFHDMVGIVQGEVSKSELAEEDLSRRIGACEQEIHTLKDFKERLERQRT